MQKKRHYSKERAERRISLAACLSMCALTIIVQIATTVLLSYFLREKASLVYAVLETVAP